MKKIGLVTIYQVPNYGSVLQAYATQNIIKEQGFECVVLNYKYPNEWHCKLDPIRGRRSLKSRIGALFGLTSGHRKANHLKKFRNQFFNFSKRYSNIHDLNNENWDSYAAFIAGSDQIWNPRFTLGDSVFLLSFLPDSCFRFSLGSSFALNEMPDEFSSKYFKYLSKFSYLSTREIQGVNVLRQLGIKNDVKVVLDPTLLLSKEEWLNLIPRSKFKKKKKYILLYMLSYAFEPRPYIYELLKYYKDIYNYDIIALEGYDKKNMLGIDMIDKTDSTIPEFIDLFNNADMVVTSSFHGTAFALNFGKPLISVVPSQKGDDRQTSLLKQLGLFQCIAYMGLKNNSLNPFFDSRELQIKLSKLRLESQQWVKDVLSLI